MHVHASALDFLIFAAMAIIFGFLSRYAAAKYADRPIGKALAFIN